VIAAEVQGTREKREPRKDRNTSAWRGQREKGAKRCYVQVVVCAEGEKKKSEAGIDTVREGVANE